jgi:hypothetical protein
VFANQIDQALDGIGFGDVKLDRLLSHVKVDFPGSATHVTKIGIGHFTGAVYYTAHDSDFDAFQVLSTGFDFRGYGLEVEKRSATRRASDKIGFERTATRGLENVESEPQRLAGAGLTPDEDSVADSIGQE